MYYPCLRGFTFSIAISHVRLLELPVFRRSIPHHTHVTVTRLTHHVTIPPQAAALVEIRPSVVKRTHNSISTSKFGKNSSYDTIPPNFLDHGIIGKMVCTQFIFLLNGTVEEEGIGRSGGIQWHPVASKHAQSRPRNLLPPRKKFPRDFTTVESWSGRCTDGRMSRRLPGIFCLQATRNQRGQFRVAEWRT